VSASSTVLTGDPVSVEGVDAGFTAAVTGGIPGGTVSLYDGTPLDVGHRVATATVVAGILLSPPSASFSVALDAGEHTLTAVYEGDEGTGVDPSTSNALVHTVTSVDTRDTVKYQPSGNWGNDLTIPPQAPAYDRGNWGAGQT
jgi:hypothetical protein